ncbi:LysR family transcriptional regulator [Zwartia vadi]|uniref:LysR family transcriptional regulator n=1 Tax=Zwartia vadi TaxID=3058168 RepID=UPI0025B625CC|nr:LysR family transcriptional regulator [Zwartia vadi]MDN3987882.1 LysR family transcriptional regulator [Zwartia vadi]
MMLTLRALRHFVVTANELHFSRAASRLHLTQSALSRSIQSLEGALGLKLLDRTASSVLLTKSGETVLIRARQVLAQTQALEYETHMIRGLESGEVAMGVGVFPAATYLPPLLTQLAKDYPGISMRVEIESWKRLLDMLERHTLDFVLAITQSLPPSAEFSVIKLPSQHGGLFVRQGHPLLTASRRTLRNSLSKYRLAATHLPPRARSLLAKLCGDTDGNNLPLALECNSLEALRNVALNTDVVLFCTREVISHELADRRLVQLPLKYPAGTELSCNIIFHANRTLSPAALKVVELIKA